MILSSRNSFAAIVDASALIDAFRRDRRVAEAVLHRRLHAPVTLDAEVLHGCRRAWFAGRMTGGEALFVIDAVADADIMRHGVEGLVNRMWELRFNISAYDAAYVALAETLDVPLLTRDARLARSSGHAARIEYIA